MFYLGTWDIGSLSRKEIHDILSFSLQLGINSYDTAAVYGKGEVEKALGNLQISNPQIITKIPAIEKPDLTDSKDILELYPLDYVLQQIKTSLRRLRAEKVHAVLLHNWTYAWENINLEDTISLLKFLKDLDIANKIGISLPNNYEGSLHESQLLQHIDIIECPHNKQNIYITKVLRLLKPKLSEIVIRSSLRDADLKDTEIPVLLNKQIDFCIQNGLSLTIGSTNKKHIKDNLNLIKSHEVSKP
jgi:aryl-alcohol dehydrogenase-like predicted oxidoreductase